MPFDWGGKLLDVALGGLPGLARLVPQHLLRQAHARLGDLNPFRGIAANEDLLRALRLSWIEAAQEVADAVSAQLNLPEWTSQADPLSRFAFVMSNALKRERDQSFDRRIHPGHSPIDSNLTEVLVDVSDYIRGAVVSAPGERLTRSFVATLGAVTGWPQNEVPALYEHVATRGLPLVGGSVARPFGELVFAAFAETIKSPGRYPEAGAAFQIAMSAMARELIIATLRCVQGLDGKLDSLLARMDTIVDFSSLDQFSHRVDGLAHTLHAVTGSLERVEARLVQAPQEVAQATVDALLAALDLRGLVGSGTKALDRQTVIGLAQRLRPQESLDFELALRELDHAVSVAVEVIATGEHAVTQDAFVNKVLERVAEHTRDGQIEAGAASIDEALAEMDRRELRLTATLHDRRRTLLEAAVRQAVLLREPERAARAVLQLGALEDSARPTCSSAFTKKLSTFSDEGLAKGANLSLEIAIELQRERLRATPGDDQRIIMRWWLAELLEQLGTREGGTARLEESVQICREALEDCAQESSCMERGVIQTTLGAALISLGRRSSDSVQLEEAVLACREALKEFAREVVPMPEQQAKTQGTLAIALASLGDREGGTVRLKEAVQAHRAALEEYTQERYPDRWAQTQVNLGTTLSILGEHETGIARLQEALQAFSEALKVLTQERAPLGWAMTQNNRASALMKIGSRESGTVRLEEAVLVYREALKEFTRERVPLNWAMTQTNLGTVLRILGERESGTARLEEAVEAHREALKEYSRERVPVMWAHSKANLSGALSTLGQRESGTARLEESVQTCREALEEYTQERTPFLWASSQNNLGCALARLGKREGGTALLEEAVQAHREALKEYTRERAPLAWAMTQNNLASALTDIGRRESGSAQLEEAVLACREALKEYTREREPQGWAMTQNNLGDALTSLGEREADSVRLEEALLAYRAALKEFTSESAPSQYAEVRESFRRALGLVDQRRSG